MRAAASAASEAIAAEEMDEWRRVAFIGWQHLCTQVERPPSFSTYLRRLGLAKKAIGEAERNSLIERARTLEAQLFARINRAQAHSQAAQAVRSDQKLAQSAAQSVRSKSQTAQAQPEV